MEEYKEGCMLAISEILRDSENAQSIRDSYASINGMVHSSEASFQKLYCKKEAMLATYLEDTLHRMGGELTHYQLVTSEAHLHKLCEDRRKDLEAERVLLLKQFMELTNRQVDCKDQLKTMQEKLLQKKQQLFRIQQVRGCCVSENVQLETRLQDLTMRQSAPLFCTQPVVYESPYSPKKTWGSRPTKAKNQKPQYPNCPVLAKIPKSVKSDVGVTKAILDLPQVRALMLKVLNGQTQQNN